MLVSERGVIHQWSCRKSVYRSVWSVYGDLQLPSCMRTPASSQIWGAWSEWNDSGIRETALNSLLGDEALFAQRKSRNKVFVSTLRVMEWQ